MLIGDKTLKWQWCGDKSAISAETAKSLRGRSHRNVRLSLCCGRLIYPKDLKQVTNGRKLPTRKTKGVFRGIRPSVNQGRKPPGQDLTGEPEVDIKTYWLLITKLPWKPRESGVCGSVLTPLCAMHESLTINLTEKSTGQNTVEIRETRRYAVRSMHTRCNTGCW